jgi:hypothetical protein
MLFSAGAELPLVGSLVDILQNASATIDHRLWTFNYDFYKSLKISVI